MSAGALTLIAVGLLFLMASSALFSSIETALFSLQPHHIERLKKRRAGLGNAVSRLMENPRRLLSALLLGDALVNLPLIIVGLYVLHTLAPQPLAWWASALILFSVIVFVCDLIPKLLALNQTYRLAKVGVAVMSVVMPVFDPLARVLQRVSKWLADLLTPKSLEPIPFLSEDELETLVQLSAEEGALQRLPEHREAVCHADAQVDAQGGGRDKPAVEAGPGDDALSGEQRRAGIPHACGTGHGRSLPPKSLFFDVAHIPLTALLPFLPWVCRHDQCVVVDSRRNPPASARSRITHRNAKTGRLAARVSQRIVSGGISPP